jgi:hypothetical protein
MAAAQTYQFTSGNREDLSEAITMISPHDTPFTSSLGTKKATGITHDWLTDVLSDPADNAVLEGADATFGTQVARVRNSNYIQNLRKTFQVSDNQEAVLKAGVKSEVKHQLGKETKNLALDTERMFTQGTRSQGVEAVAGAGQTGVSRAGGLMYWLSTNQVAGSAAAAVTGTCTGAGTSVVINAAAGHGAVAGQSYIMITGGVGQGQYRLVTAVATNALTVATLDVATTATSTYSVFVAPAALTETVLNDAFEACFNAGGNPNTVFAPTKQKRAISGLNAANRRLTSTEKTMGNSIDVYESDFGMHSVKTNRWMPAGSLAVVETAHFSAAYLRPVKAEELARTGSSTKYMLESAVTLESRAENASALILGLA